MPTKKPKKAPAKKSAPAKARVAAKARSPATSAARPKPVSAGRDNSNNERLRALVEALGVTQEEALKRFNVGFGIKPMSMNAWKSYFVNPSSSRHRHFGDVLLNHAEKRLT